MRQRNVRWGLCVSALFALPAACGGGSDSNTPNVAGNGGANAGAGAIAGGAHAGQASTAGTANLAGAPSNSAGASGAAVAGSANGGQSSTGGGGASSAGSNNGGGGASSAGTSGGGAGNGGGGASNGGGGASNGGGGASNGGGGASNGGGGASNGGGGASNGGGGASSAGANNGGGGASSGGGGQGGGMAGGAGAGGAPQIGCALPTILDDMEDGNDGICPHPVRKGGWFVANSGGVTTTPAASALFPAFPLTNDPHGSSNYGMHLIGTGFSTTSVWATLGASVATTGAYDATGYTGITFWAKSHTGALLVRFNLSTTEARSAANGGTCVPANSSTPCDDAYGKFISVDNTWQQYSVPFTSTGQSGWGTVVTRNMAHLVTVEFNYVQKPYNQNTTNPSSFEFLVDDLQFN